MAFHVQIEAEEKIQEKDRTRVSAAYSFSDVAANSITRVVFKLGSQASDITVNETDPDLWYVDSTFPFTFDIISTNKYLDFSESGTEFTATLVEAAYTPTQLATQITTQMNAEGALTYTCTWDEDTRKFTIEATGEFSLLAETGDSFGEGLLPWIGFDEDEENASTYESLEVDAAPKKITVTVSTGGSNPVSDYVVIRVMHALSDRLWSTDQQLKSHEPDILKWVQAGRSSYKNTHRLAQEDILAWFDRNGFVDTYGNKFTKTSFPDGAELAEWSKFVTLRLIMDGVSNQIDDVFFRKARQYESLEKAARDRAILRLDLNKDGEVGVAEEINVGSGVVLRR